MQLILMQGRSLYGSRMRQEILFSVRLFSSSLISHQGPRPSDSFRALASTWHTHESFFDYVIFKNESSVKIFIKLSSETSSCNKKFFLVKTQGVSVSECRLSLVSESTCNRKIY